jgi:FimV-like protein
VTARSALLFAVALLGCATPADVVDGEAWVEVRTPAFSLAGNLDADAMRGLAAELAVFDAVVRKVTNTRIADDRAPMRLYVIPDGAEAKRLMSPGAAGVIYPMLDGYDAVLAGSQPAWTRTTLLHEYTHYVLLGGRRAPIPRWYNEGLSEFLAYTYVRENVVILGGSATSRLQVLARRPPLPLDRLFGWDASRPVDAHRFYATAWALTHHLNTSRELNRESRAFLERLARGEDWRTAYDASFDRPLAELEASLAEHIAALQRGALRGFSMDLRSVQVPDDFAVQPVAPADIAYRLGDLVRRVALAFPESDSFDRPRARQLFEQALRSDPDHRRARAALAWTLAAEERFERAAEEIRAAGGDASPDPRIALDRGRIAALEAVASGSADAHAAARALLERAVALAPEQPEPHAALARLLAAQASHPAAIAAFEQARALGAWSPPLEVALAREYREVGERERAIALLRPVAADPHESELAREARRLLAEIDAGG